MGDVLTSFDPSVKALLAEHRAAAELDEGYLPGHGQLVERRFAQSQKLCSFGELEQLVGGRHGGRLG